MILTGSRYVGQPVVHLVVDAEGDTAACVFGPPPSTSATFYYHTVVQGDRLDNLANDLYGVPDYWWKIAFANPEIFYPDDLVVGSIIRIPTT